MLEVYACCAIRGHNNLQLVVPSVRACSHLDSAPEVVCAAEEIVTQFCKVFRGGVVKTNYEQCIVDDLKARFVVPISGKGLSEG